MENTSRQTHPFLHSPHFTLISLSFPVLFSLIAEPITGLVDTAFVSRLGSESLAALGVGTMALSSIFWVFNFLGIGTQTEVAQAFGRHDLKRTSQINGLAIVLSLFFGILLVVIGFPVTDAIAKLMGALAEVHTNAVRYMQIRLLGAPAVLVTLTAFGTLRGLQNMRAPLWIAVSVNTLNIVLDALLIFGIGPFPSLGIAGAAWASVLSQWFGAIWATLAIYNRLSPPGRICADDIRKLLRIGGDLLIRTGLILAFMLLCTRLATRLGPDSGAAHQAIRQVWVFTALVLDAYAITGQSLVGYFVGPQWLPQAKRVAFVVCSWSLATGIALTVVMWLGQNIVVVLFVPASSIEVFAPAWIVASLTQPLNALAFATDGIHWGTGDYRFLRNVMMIATSAGAIALSFLDENISNALTGVWVITGGWIGIRAVLGIARLWPGIGNSPFDKLTCK